VNGPLFEGSTKPFKFGKRCEPCPPNKNPHYVCIGLCKSNVRSFMDDCVRPSPNLAWNNTDVIVRPHSPIPTPMSGPTPHPVLSLTPMQKRWKASICVKSGRCLSDPSEGQPSIQTHPTNRGLGRYIRTVQCSWFVGNNIYISQDII
jgi:hypothetical protein